MKKRIIAWLAVAGGLTLSLGVTVGAYQISKMPLDNFVSQLSVMGNPTTALTVEELLTDASEHMNTFMNTPVEWTADSGTLIATPMDLGLQVQLEGLEEELERLDNSGFSKLMLYVSDKDLSIPCYIDDARLQLAFDGSGLEQGMKNASYYYEGSVQIDADQTGYGIEYDELHDQLVTLWEYQALSDVETLPIRTSEPTITTELLESHLDQVSSLADSGLTLQENDGTEWNLWLADHLDWIIPSDDGFKLSDTAFYAFLRDEIAEAVEEEAQSVIITNVEGEYEFEGSARYGRMIDYEATLLEVEAMINSDETSPIVITVNEVDPEITVTEELALLGVTELLGYGYSNFSGSPTARVYNVTHGMSLFNGTMLAPGEEFSFTTLMGDIDAANGWYPELVIKGDETIPEYGGGLCQVSSTMFRAALLTGMPVTSRRNHSYAVSYYAYPDGYGLDATIYDPYPDFRFTNDTAGHMLIQGYTDGVEAYFVFYGTSDDRSVTMEKGDAYGYYSISEPKIEYTSDLAPGVRVLEEYSHTGFQIDWWRTIYYADGTESERENYHSDYEARPAKYSEGLPAEEEGEE
jgi:vancomycin resistance protein YoaR